MEFLKCKHCGNIATKLYDSGVNIVCCGENMHVLQPNTFDAANEKHVPILTLKDNVLNVKVGSIMHPMTSDHHIVFVVVDNGGVVTVKQLDHTAEPVASFVVDINKPIEVYEYCNLHGLWSAKL